ncbi:MAG: TraB/GumN family protein [Cyclobacteriaceae bacterium]|nr:TraB/GumN family protein [Cyclobacteriaceae bacterium]
MKTLFVALFCLLSLTVRSQQSILWEISGNDLKSPSYLMGVMKFIGEKEFYLPKEVSDKMTQCKIFAIEDQVDHKAQMEVNKAIHFPKGKSLATELSPEDYAKVIAFVDKEFHMPKAKFEKDLGKLIPLALSINMTRMALGEKVKYYDIELLLLAKQNKLKAYSLEPIEREAQALHSFPMDKQREALMESMTNFEDQKSDYLKLEAAFVANDAETAFSVTLHPTDDNPDFVQEFYTKRNMEWLPKLDKMMHDKPAFIAVGLSHLKGENGLLALLRSKGYTLTAVPLTR